MRYLLCGINAKYIHSNLAIFCLKAYAKEYGSPKAEYIIKEYTINHYTEDILKDLYQEKADVLIFSCYIWNISYVKELAAEYKKLCPDTPIWAGGPEVSYHGEEFLQNNPSIDLLMQGEGEEQFTALVNLWEERKASSEIAAQMSDGKKIINSGYAAPVDMDRIPFVYDDFQLFDHKIIYYETSRGCPYSCSYCLSSVDKSVRFRSLSLVLPELQRFLDAGVPQVKFVDRTFNCNKDHALAIWKYIHEHDRGITNFHFEISADLLDEEMMNLFAKMRPGLIQLEIGVQSTHDPTILAIRRRMNLGKLFFNVDRIHTMGNIHQHLDLIAGLPYEGYEQFGKSFNDIYAHAPDQLQLGFLKVLKGTFMEEKQKDYGLVCRSLPPYEVLKTRWLGYDEIIRLKGVEEMVETYYNSMEYTWTLKYVTAHFPSPFRFYESFADWYQKKNYHRMNHSRMKKYEILRAFLLEWNSIISEETHMEDTVLDEMLLLDMYSRENVKKRPSWAPDQTPFKKQWKEMYRKEGEKLFPALWAKGSYDSKAAANHSHIEHFSFQTERFMKEGVIEKGECLVLFDYQDRSPLDYNAKVRVIG